jgi:hypothetical protein
MRQIKPVILIGFLSLLISACTNSVGLDPSLLPTTRLNVQPIEGEGAVAMTRADEAEILSVQPASFTGGATTLNVPVNLIVKAAAEQAFSQAFEEGVVSTTDTDIPEGTQYVVYPIISTFNYKYDQVSNLGFAITPRVSLAFEVRVEDRAGDVVYSEIFQRTDFAHGTYLASAAPHNRINAALHLAAGEMMAEAATDFVNSLDRAGRRQSLPQSEVDTPVSQ